MEASNVMIRQFDKVILDIDLLGTIVADVFSMRSRL